LPLQGQGQTVFELFENWKGYASKLDIFCRDITTGTYQYFPNVKAHSNRFIVHRDELQKYVQALKAEFAKRGQDFQIQGPIFSYLIKPDLIDLTTTLFDLSLFEWIDGDNFEMQHIEFNSSELWTIKFVELRETLVGNCLEKSAAILNCWTFLPEAFTCLNKVAFALLSAFGSTYTCEQTFSHMKVHGEVA
jgi:hypothetical protein